MVVSRAYLLEWAAAASGGVDNWRGSPWRQWWRRQALAPVCVFAMYSSARVRLGSDFGFYAHGPWKTSRRARNDPRAVHVYAYAYVYVYVYVYVYMYMSGFCLTAAWRILVSFLLVSFSLVCFRSLAAAVGATAVGACCQLNLQFNLILTLLVSFGSLAAAVAATAVAGRFLETGFEYVLVLETGLE